MDRSRVMHSQPGSRDIREAAEQADPGFLHIPARDDAIGAGTVAACREPSPVRPWQRTRGGFQPREIDA